ncbi:MAG: phosphoribosylformylglycinamidine synthase [Phycisphaerales bacterium]|nr:phosphoribosylformylglycinamidine synthase [Phycisphaerales bacterium]
MAVSTTSLYAPRALVITAPGINCDSELAAAFEAAGARAQSVLLETLRRRPDLIDEFDLIGLPGGFSYGDDIAAGRIMAALMRKNVYPALRGAIERGVPIICPCNGFQIAVQCGLLPGPSDDHWPAESAAASIALCPNRDGRFEDRWTAVEIPAHTCCVWTRGLDSSSAMVLPSAHGEGRLVASSTLIAHLSERGQIALRYGTADNFNGSADAIAGICDSSGLVLGLMPHPERFTRWVQHPRWTRMSKSERMVDPLGLRIFKAAVQHTRSSNGREVSACAH